MQFQLHTRGTRGPPESPCGKKQDSARASHSQGSGGSHAHGLGRQRGNRGRGDLTLQKFLPSLPAHSMSSLMCHLKRSHLVLPVTDPIPHTGDSHLLLQLVGRGQQRCGEGLAENQGWSQLLLLPNSTYSFHSCGATPGRQRRAQEAPLWAVTLASVPSTHGPGTKLPHGTGLITQRVNI